MACRVNQTRTKGLAMRPGPRFGALLLTLASITAACRSDRQRGSAPTSAVRPPIAAPQVASQRVTIGRIVLALPPGFAIEHQQDVDYGGGISGRSILIQRSAIPQSFIVDCDDISTARMVASYVTVST
jgi:hypothetical protein